MTEEFKHVVRILNTDIDGKKHLSIGLTHIKGIGINLANSICIISGIEKTKKIGYLTSSDIDKIEEIISNPNNHKIPVWMLNRRRDYEDNTDSHLLKTDLDFAQDNDIKRLRKIRCYKGIRHGVGLPVRGQRTKSNFRKNKGKVKGVSKKKGKSGRV